jgi:hypothetical protein
MPKELYFILVSTITYLIEVNIEHQTLEQTEATTRNMGFRRDSWVSWICSRAFGAIRI